MQTKGNSVGGNPFAGKLNKVRQIFFETISDDDIVELTKKLVELGKEGDFRAIKFTLTYMLGSPDEIHRSADEYGPPMTTRAFLAPSSAPSTNGIFDNLPERRPLTIAKQKTRLGKKRRRKH